MNNIATTVEVSWSRALENPTALAWGRIADMLWGIGLYINYMESENAADDYEDALALYDIADWRARQCWN